MVSSVSMNMSVVIEKLKEIWINIVIFNFFLITKAYVLFYNCFSRPWYLANIVKYGFKC